MSRLFIAFVGTAFARIGGVLGTVVPDQLLTADDLCANEVDVRTAPTASQWFGYFTGHIEEQAYVSLYLRELYLSNLWGQYCECTPGAGGTCSSIAVNWTTFTNLGDPGDNRNAGIIITAGGSPRTLYGANVYNYGSPTISRLILWNAATTTIVAQKNTTSPGTGKQTVFFDTPYVIPAGQSRTLAYSWTGVQRYLHWGTNAAPPASDGVTYSGYVENSDYSVCPTASRTYKALLEPLSCSVGVPSGYAPPYTPVAPVDPVDVPDQPADVCSTLGDICTRLHYLENVVWLGTRNSQLIKDSVAPENWSGGTTSSGLTGTGTIAVEGILGLFVSATVPGYWGKTYQTPSRFIPAIGSIQWSIDGVVMDENQLHYDEEQLLGAPPACDGVVYNFKPGVVASITPLVRQK